MQVVIKAEGLSMAWKINPVFAGLRSKYKVRCIPSIFHDTATGSKH